MHPHNFQCGINAQKRIIFQVKTNFEKKKKKNVSFSRIAIKCDWFRGTSEYVLPPRESDPLRMEVPPAPRVLSWTRTFFKLKIGFTLICCPKWVVKFYFPLKIYIHIFALGVECLESFAAGTKVVPRKDTTSFRIVCLSWTHINLNQKETSLCWSWAHTPPYNIIGSFASFLFVFGVIWLGATILLKHFWHF